MAKKIQIFLYKYLNMFMFPFAQFIRIVSCASKTTLIPSHISEPAVPFLTFALSFRPIILPFEDCGLFFFNHSLTTVWILFTVKVLTFYERLVTKMTQTFFYIFNNREWRTVTIFYSDIISIFNPFSFLDQRVYCNVEVVTIILDSQFVVFPHY